MRKTYLIFSSESVKEEYSWKAFKHLSQYSNEHWITTPWSWHSSSPVIIGIGNTEILVIARGLGYIHVMAIGLSVNTTWYGLASFRSTCLFSVKWNAPALKSLKRNHNYLEYGNCLPRENKCSVGPETSIFPSGKGQGPTSFSERGLFFFGLTVKIEEKNSPLEEKETAETFSIKGILVSCPTDTLFLPLKRHDPNQKSMK